MGAQRGPREPSQQPRQAQSVTRPRCGLSTRGFPTPRVVSVQPRPRAQESGFRVPDQGTLGPPETLGKAGVGPEVRISGLLLCADPGGDGAWCSCLVPCVIHPGHAPESWVMESQAKPPPPVLTGSAHGALFPLGTKCPVQGSTARGQGRCWGLMAEASCQEREN